LADFMADYEAHVAVDSRIYPGVEPVLTDMRGRGWTLAVCTNKPERAARSLLQAVGLLPMMAAVGGGDSFPVRKPDPAHLLATLSLADGRPEQAVMLGDHRNDIACTANTPVASIFAAWGYGSRDMAAGATAIAGNIAEAAAIAQRLRPNV
ncbi:MAG: phosphoglycolate phosphatase, partial [Rhodospirillales bacterium 20-64-7]